MDDRTNQASRIATLDLLRLLAALAVVGFHYFFRGAAGQAFLDTSYPHAARFALYGYLGVNLFFLISGFVIAWSAQGRDWRSFAIARFARIYPGFIVCVAISFTALALAGDPRLPVAARQLAANFFIFAPALGQPFVDGVYWSIVIELIFYGWVAVALFFGIFERWKLPLLAGWLALCALNEWVIGSGAARLVFITEFGPLFVGGILVHHLHSKGWSARAGALFAISFGLSCAMLPISKDWMQSAYGVSAPLSMLIASNFALHGLLVVAVLLQRIIRPSPLILLLGGLTYPLYLLHQNIGYVAINELEPAMGRWGAAAIALAAVMTISWMIWRFVETPARRVLTRGMMHLTAWTDIPKPASAAN